MQYSISEFEAIYMRAFAPSMRLAVSMLHDADEARDVVQEAFLRLWESEAEIANPEGMVVRAVRNACLNRIEHAEVRERFRKRYPLESSALQDDGDDACAEVRAAMGRLLSERERQVVERVYADGMTYKEAAQSLDVSVSLINKCVVSALKTLRKHFKTHKI